MFVVQRTEEFRNWHASLRDKTAARAVDARITRAELGNLGEHKSVGGKVSEMILSTGPGYRLYFTRGGQTIIVLLCGGDKSTQDKDIARAQEMAAAIHE